MQFKNLDSVPQEQFLPTIRYVFEDVEGQPWLEAKPMTDRNKPYYNAMLQRMASIRKKLQRGKLSLQMLDAQRSILRELCALHVVTAMGGWVDENDQPAESNRENIAALMLALPQRQFDEMTETLGDDDSFRPDAAR
jgi:hypothetical protein